MKQKELKIGELKATKAAAILKLPEGDPALWFYQAVELYENQQFQDSLDLFISAFKNRILHAWPYLSRLMDAKNPLVRSSEQQNLIFEDFKTQACALGYSEIDINGYFLVSQTIIAQDKAFAKEQGQKSKNKTAKKSQSQRAKEAYFKNLKEDCPHFHYHASLVSGQNNPLRRYMAARTGHFLAIAECLSTKNKDVPAQLRTVYGETLCSPDFHVQHEKQMFAYRIFIGAIEQKERVGKLALHFESSRLGVLDAFSMIAHLYFVTEKKFDQAIGLVHFGIQHNDPQSRVVYTTSIMNASDDLKKSRTNLGHEGVVTMLLSNITGNYAKSSVVFSRSQEDFYRQLPAQSARTLLEYLSFYCDDEALLSLPHLVDQLEAAAQQHAKDKSVSRPLYGALHQITSRQRRLTKNLLETIALESKTILFLDKCLECNYDPTVAMDKFSIIADKVTNLSKIDNVEKSTLIQEYLEVFKFIERFKEYVLAKDNPHRFLEKKIQGFILLSFTICAYLYKVFQQEAIKPTIFPEIESAYLYYRKLGTDLHMRDCVMDAARNLIHPEKNYAKARELWASYKGNHNQNSLMLEAIAYLLDPVMECEEKARFLESRGRETPFFYDLLGDVFKGGFVGIQQNRLRARHYFELGDSGGCLESTLSLGILALEDYNSAPEAQKPSLREIAIRNFGKLVDVPHCDGYLFRGKLSLYGACGEPQDLEKAMSDFQRAAELGNIEAGALLAMIKAGYRGSAQTVGQLIARYEYLMDQGTFEHSPTDLCNFGILLLSGEGAEKGLEYILKAAVFNQPEAQCLIASFQLMDQVGLLELRADILLQIQQYDCAHVHHSYNDLYISEAVKNIYQFSLAMKKGIEDGREISFDYFLDTLSGVVLSASCDIKVVIKEMQKKFPDSERKKTLELVQKMNSNASGDQVCASHTRSLLSGTPNPEEKLMRKIKSLKEGDEKISEHNIRECLGSFFRSSVLLHGKDKKAVTAVQKMHPHHGNGSHKGNDEVDGGRRKTAIAGFEAMLRSTQELMSGANVKEKESDTQETTKERDLNTDLSL